MKISLISLLLILWINSIVSDDGVSPLLATLGSAVLPIMCDGVNSGGVPSIVKAIYDAATGGAKCIPGCTKPAAGGYTFTGPCDSSSLSDEQKDNFCQNFSQSAVGLVRLLACQPISCTTSADGNFFISVTCPPAPISLASLTSLL